MRLIFAGTPATALPSLRTLLDSQHEVVAVLTCADAPAGRGRKLTASPVKTLALEAGVPVLTPQSLRDPQVQAQLRALDADAAAVVAYGKLVPAEALAIPTHGWVNLHFSLLPELRGAAPAQRAVLSGATQTGMSVFRLDEGLDTGEIITTRERTIGPYETAGELLEAMAEDGATLLLEALDAMADGTATFTVQDHEAATHAAKLSSAEARIDWDLPAQQVSARIRGMSPQPGAWTDWQGTRMKVLGLEPAPQMTEGDRLAPGRLLATKRHLLVGTATDPLAIALLAPPGKRPMRGADWARGAGLAEDAAFDSDDQKEQR